MRSASVCNPSVRYAGRLEKVNDDMDWLEQALTSTEFGVAVLPAAVLLGLVTAVTSCCNIGIAAAVAGYAGSRDQGLRRREALLTSVFFLIGTTFSLAVLGLIVGYFGQLAGESFGRYGTALAGFAAVFFGLVTLGLLPFRLPSVALSGKKSGSGLIGSAAFGLAVGAGSITCTLACCGPLLPVVLGVAASRGQAGWGALILTMFAVGYSLPLAALMLGIGLGRTMTVAQKAVKPIRIIAGVGLIIVGFWLLATM